MSNFKIVFAAVLFVAVAVLSADAQNAGEEEALVRANVTQMEKGWNARSGAEFAAPLGPDADYVVNVMHVKGKDAIEKSHAQLFASVYNDSVNAATVKSVRFLRPDVAVVHVEWNLKFKVNGEERAACALNTIVMTKENGKWHIAAFHNTPVRSRQ